MKRRRVTWGATALGASGIVVLPAIDTALSLSVGVGMFGFAPELGTKLPRAAGHWRCQHAAAGTAVGLTTTVTSPSAPDLLPGTVSQISHWFLFIVMVALALLRQSLSSTVPGKP
jgi:hypothetical protein